jgi:hypothetical protein
MELFCTVDCREALCHILYSFCSTVSSCGRGHLSTCEQTHCSNLSSTPPPPPHPRAVRQGRGTRGEGGDGGQDIEGGGGEGVG